MPFRTSMNSFRYQLIFHERIAKEPTSYNQAKQQSTVITVHQATSVQAYSHPPRLSRKLQTLASGPRSEQFVQSTVPPLQGGEVKSKTPEETGATLNSCKIEPFCSVAARHAQRIPSVFKYTDE